MGLQSNRIIFKPKGLVGEKKHDRFDEAFINVILERMGGAEAAAEQEMEENMQSVGG